MHIYLGRAWASPTIARSMNALWSCLNGQLVYSLVYIMLNRKPISNSCLLRLAFLMIIIWLVYNIYTYIYYYVVGQGDSSDSVTIVIVSVTISIMRAIAENYYRESGYRHVHLTLSCLNIPKTTWKKKHAENGKEYFWWHIDHDKELKVFLLEGSKSGVWE